MNYSVHGTLSGSVQAPVSKSDLHRLIIAAALCPGDTTVIAPYTLNDDIRATASIMEMAGASIVFEKTHITVRGILQPKQDFCADCRESGSTLRFLVPVLAALNARCRFVGEGRLPQRPITPLREQLEKHDVSFSAENLPFAISGQLRSGVYTFPGNVSSQYITGLLLALPLLPGDSRIVLTSPLESQGYVDMTLSVLQRFGIGIDCPSPLEFSIRGGQSYRSPGRVTAEGDWSNGAFWLAAGALSGPVTVNGLQLSSLQGDKAVCSILEKMGANVRYQGDSITVETGKLQAVTIDGSQIPDIVPILAVVTAFAEGSSHIVNAGRLRIKESDRLTAVAQCLSAIGAQIQEGSDSLTITGKAVLQGGSVDSFGDHRIAMSMAIASLGCENPVRIADPLCVKKSYPGFYEEFSRLGGAVDVI